jgi:hypothetical protein
MIGSTGVIYQEPEWNPKSTGPNSAKSGWQPLTMSQFSEKVLIGENKRLDAR